MTVTLDEFGDADDTDTTDVFLTNISYTEEGGKPIVHVMGRDEDGNHVHQEVYGHNPHFSVPASEYDERVANHYAVENVSSGLQTLDGEDSETNDSSSPESTTSQSDEGDTYRIETSLPKHVGDLRNFFENPLEADVLYETRWLIDNEITTGIRVPSSGGRCHVSDAGPCDSPQVQPRIVTVDIEVASEHGFPEADEADWPVVSIVAHDSYGGEYVGWMLASDAWDGNTRAEMDGAFAGQEALEAEAECDDVRVFDDEQNLLDDFNHYIEEQQPDILTGWNSNDFDYPYLINRCRNLDVWSYMNWSPLEEVYTSKYGPVCEGVAMLDMMHGYEKTQIHNLDDKSLDAVAADELDAQKLEFDGSYTDHWKQRPVEFLQYNQRDTELVTRIDDEAGVTELFTNIRDLSGVGYEDPVGGNFQVMDSVFLRRARDYGYVLPTAEQPDRGWYYGAYVFEPEPGLHEHVIYLDVASLYPSIIAMLNISPESIVGKEQPSHAYTKSYIDRRDDNIKQDDEPRYEPIYYDNRERAFVPSLVDELIGLKNEYRGTDMYEATKRITNSIYGVLSDSDSYSKGFRLFDWRMGESITLAGRKIIQHISDDSIEWCHRNGYEDATIVVGDTDGFGIRLPSADDMDEALRVGWKLEQYINDEAPAMSADLFEIDESQNEIEIECESYSERLFVKADSDGTGVRKKYAELERWEQ